MKLFVCPSGGAKGSKLVYNYSCQAAEGSWSTGNFDRRLPGPFVVVLRYAAKRRDTGRMVARGGVVCGSVKTKEVLNVGMFRCFPVEAVWGRWTRSDRSVLWML